MRAIDVIEKMTETEEWVRTALAPLSTEQKRELVSGTLQHFGFSGVWPDENIATAIARLRGSAMIESERVILDVAQFIARCC
jgi:hypothetical protein